MNRRPPRNDPPQADSTGSLYRGPAPARDKRTRERDARAQADERPRVPARHPREQAPAYTHADQASSHPPTRRDAEQRLFGLNACLALFARRPQDLRKVYLSEQRVGVLKAVLAFCVKQRLGYRVVETEDLDKLTGTQHHEGMCFDVARRAPLTLAQLLATQPAAPQSSLLVLLDGVGNPHNVGAVLRSAANFGAGGLIVPAEAPGMLSGAACRVAEGGAEAVPMAQLAPGEDALAMLRAVGYAIAATVPRDGAALFAKPLPARLVLIFGAEGEGMSEPLIRGADLRLTIPGSGAVESLNISASAAVLMAEWWRIAHA